MKIKIWWIILLLLAILGGAYLGYMYLMKGNVDLDNAGEERLEVTIGAEKYLIGPKETKDIKLEKGYHKIQVKDMKGTMLRDTLFELGEGGLINLAGAEYLIWKDVFSPRSTLEERQTLLKTRSMKAGNQTFDIEYDSLPPNQLYVEQFWDHRINEDFPGRVYGWQMEKGMKYMFKTKLLRRDELATVYLRMSKME